MKKVMIQGTASLIVVGHLTTLTQIMWDISHWRFNCQSARTAPDICQSQWLTEIRWDSIFCQNVSRKVAALVCGGRLFHARAAATGNEWSLRADRRADNTSIVRVSSGAQTATTSNLWCQSQAVSQIRWCCAVLEHTAGTGFTPDGDDQQPLMSIAGCQPDTMVLCCARTHSRNWIHSRMHSQCSSRSTGVMCSDIWRE